MKKLLATFTAFVALTHMALADPQVLRMAVTTSFHNSDLSGFLLPRALDDLNIDVQLLVVGTGQALRLGEAGDVDAILVHSRAAEEKFVADGYGTHRREIMYNDFVLAGPSDDPAGATGSDGIGAVLTKVAKAEAIFVSRGDDSGTHRRELSLWALASVDTDAADPAWYRAAGAGMGATLNTAVGMNGYVLTDRASWLNFANKADLAILFQGDPALFNQYAYLPVNPKKHPHVKADLAITLEGWLTSPKVQALIGGYQIDGENLFVPNATTDGISTDG